MSQFEVTHPFVAAVSIWPSNQRLKNTVTPGGLLRLRQYPSASSEQKSQPEHCQTF